MDVKLLLTFSLLGFGLFMATRTQTSIPKQQVTPYSPYTQPLPLPIEPEIIGWQIPPAGRPFTDLFDAASVQYGIPNNLLARVAYQESHFRPDIITGQTISSAGAVGIMQIVPRWHPTVDPLDIETSIFYAAKYLNQLYNQFGSWPMALAAYNWGPTNLSQKGFGSAPLETQNYVSQIAADVMVT